MPNSFLSNFGKDFVKVFHWLGSTQGQNTIAAVEGTTNIIVGAVDPLAVPALTGIEALINAGLRKILDVEATAAAVGAQSGTGAQKAAAVTAYLSSQSSDLLKSVGVPSPTADQIQTVASAVSSGLVAVLNALPAPATPTT
jgi:hypothetical protein